MINDQPRSAKTHIMHLTTKLELSGSEAIILGLAKYHPDRKDRVTVCSLTSKIPYIKCLKNYGMPVNDRSPKPGLQVRLLPSPLLEIA